MTHSITSEILPSEEKENYGREEDLGAGIATSARGTSPLCQPSAYTAVNPG